MTQAIFVGMPTANGLVRHRTTISLYNLGVHLAARGIGSRLVGIDGSNLIEARDHIAHQFLGSDASHLLFVDSDMEFLPNAVDLLLAANKPVIAVACTQKQIDFARMKSALVEGQNFEESFVRAHRFNIRGDWKRDGSLVEVDEVGTGLMLIAREALDQLKSRTRLRHYHYNGEDLVGFFDRMMDGETLLSEDLSFCRRYRAAGGKVFVHPQADVRHIGEMSFGFPLEKILPKGDSAVRSTDHDDAARTGAARQRAG